MRHKFLFQFKQTLLCHTPQERDLGVCEHPLSDIVIAGEAAHPLPHTFHRLLQTISDLMMSLPGGSSLQQMALRYPT